jgi:putative CocE/NonD family hydrolase
LWLAWYSGIGYTYRPLFPANLPREALLRLARFWSLEPNRNPDPRLDTLVWTLPLNRILQRMEAPPNDMDDFVNRLPNDPRWASVEFGGEGDRYSAPALMINSWYDVSIGPNAALYEYQVKHAATEVARNNQFMVVAPTTHCSMGEMETEHTRVGDRDLGDARFDYVGLVQRWFDHFLKGVDNGVTAEPKVRAYLMGANQWRSYAGWPPPEARAVTYFLDSNGGANSRMGDGQLTLAQPKRAGRDAFVYDPKQPVPSLGGSVCCFHPSLQGGSFDQSHIEMRADVLVYSTPPLEQPVAIAGPVKVTLYLSSDARDTDLTVKLVDVHPDGRAFNLDESIQRVRWREGWERPVWMEPGKVCPVEVGPLVTSNEFLVGHRIRIEVSSSNFPRFERNLNTGGNNYDESSWVVARNTIHHGPAHPSAIVLPVLPAGR